MSKGRNNSSDDIKKKSQAEINRERLLKDRARAREEDKRKKQEAAIKEEKFAKKSAKRRKQADAKIRFENIAKGKENHQANIVNNAVKRDEDKSKKQDKAIDEDKLAREAAKRREDSSSKIRSENIAKGEENHQDKVVNNAAYKKQLEEKANKKVEDNIQFAQDAAERRAEDNIKVNKKAKKTKTEKETNIRDVNLKQEEIELTEEDLELIQEIELIKSYIAGVKLLNGNNIPADDFVEKLSKLQAIVKNTEEEIDLNIIDYIDNLNPIDGLENLQEKREYLSSVKEQIKGDNITLDTMMEYCDLLIDNEVSLNEYRSKMNHKELKIEAADFHISDEISDLLQQYQEEIDDKDKDLKLEAAVDVDLSNDAQLDSSKKEAQLSEDNKNKEAKLDKIKLKEILNELGDFIKNDVEKTDNEKKGSFKGNIYRKITGKEKGVAKAMSQSEMKKLVGKYNDIVGKLADDDGLKLSLGLNPKVLKYDESKVPNKPTTKYRNNFLKQITKNYDTLYIELLKENPKHDLHYCNPQDLGEKNMSGKRHEAQEQQQLDKGKQQKI